MTFLSKRALPVIGLATVLIFVLFSLAVQPAAAASIVVNTDADNTTAGDTFCTLREAINNANSDSDTTSGDCAAGSGADAIAFAADYTITLAGSQLPAITTAVTITGNGPANTIIQSNAAPNTATYRVFEVAAAGNLTLDGVTVRHGHCAGACNTEAFGGGGIYNDGTLTVSNSTVSGNSASGGGGGIYNWEFSALTVRNSTFSGNSGAAGGGIANQEAALTVSNSTFSGNSAGAGGGIYIDKSLVTVTSSTFSGNSARGGGGGIYNESVTTLTVTNSSFSGNTASDTNYGGGGIANWGGSTANVTNSTFSSNSANVQGGGILNRSSELTLTDSTLSGNSAELGGGVFTVGGTLTVSNSTLFGNMAAKGGGIYGNGSSSPWVTNSTFSANTASDSGGGIFNDGDPLIVTNSTFYGNEAPNGGAIHVSGNTGLGPWLVNSLLTANTPANCAGAPTANASSIADDGSCAGTTTKTVGEINLDPILADNGGPTFTHALLPGSHAIDFNSTASCASDPNGVDQRGEPRSIDIPGEGNDGGANLCDTGAFEVQLPTTGTIIINKVATPADGTIFSFTDDIESPNNSFTLQAPGGDTKTFSNVPTGGSYTVTELDTPGWPLTDLQCNAIDASTTSTDLAGGFIVVDNLEADDTVTCTFTNTQCQPGFFDNGGNSCVPAPAGSFVDTPGATSATECPAGKWQDQQGQTSCKDAEPGSFVPGPGATEATLCAAGFYQPISGATECLAAEPGFFVPGPGATEQTECPAGTTSQVGATECTPVNGAPTADPGGPYLGAINTPIEFDGSGSSDPDDDELTFDWDFGDDSTGMGEMPTHSYTAAGIYDICLTVNDGTVDSPEACILAVVYDPTGGFVTGGGWIWSEAGAYLNDPLLEGKASFGFVAKYNKGQSTPDGNTQFQFKAGDLNFHSTSYDWLVVAGANAKFKGVGTINGAGEYGFMITARDGDLLGGGQVDGFRIKIWDADGVVAYDNQMGQDDSSETTTDLGGGSIVIHKAKK